MKSLKDLPRGLPKLYNTRKVAIDANLYDVLVTIGRDNRCKLNNVPEFLISVDRGHRYNTMLFFTDLQEYANQDVHVDILTLSELDYMPYTYPEVVLSNDMKDIFVVRETIKTLTNSGNQSVTDGLLKLLKSISYIKPEYARNSNLLKQVYTPFYANIKSAKRYIDIANETYENLQMKHPCVSPGIYYNEQLNKYVIFDLDKGNFIVNPKLDALIKQGLLL